MEIKRYEDMDLQALDVMREIGSIGTSHAATALSKLLQKEVRISIPSVNILGYNDAMNRIGDAEELVAAALVKMSGDIEGLMLFLSTWILQMRYWKNCLETVMSLFWIWMKWPDQHW